MTPSRREFLGAVSAASLAGLSCSPVDDARAGFAGAAATGEQDSAADDPLGVREEFPVTRDLAYMDNAYITPSPNVVVEAGGAFLRAKASGPISLGDMLGETDRARAGFARLVGATEAEIGMLYATSDGENIVARALDLGAGDNVVIDDLHYETTYLLYQELARTAGVEVRRVQNRSGAAPVDLFASQVDDRTKLVSVAWVSHENGYRHDLKALAELAHASGAYLYADAIQGLGMLPLDVRETGIDFFTAGTYKWLLGGYGVAPFYVREELLDLVDVDRYGSLHVSEDWATFDTAFMPMPGSTGMPPSGSERSISYEPLWISWSAWGSRTSRITPFRWPIDCAKGCLSKGIPFGRPRRTGPPS